MRTIYGIGGVERPKGHCVLAIGIFDGMHRGHQSLISRALAKAQAIGRELFVMTFSPHPVSVLHPERGHKDIVTMPHRLRLIESAGADSCIVIPFNRRFANLSPEYFVKRYLVERVSPVDVFVGSDFRFGHDREGTLNLFKEFGRKYGFSVDVVHCLESKHEKISSTSIRQSLQAGDLDGAARLLGRNYDMLHEVKKGQRRGTRLGFPTINFYPEDLVLPPFGVYATRVHVGDKIQGAMTYVGVRPMFETKGKVGVETFIFDFKKDLYGKAVLVEFIKWIRPEKTFPTQDAFIAQMEQDELKARKILT